MGVCGDAARKDDRNGLLFGKQFFETCCYGTDDRPCKRGGNIGFFNFVDNLSPLFGGVD